ncbi:hypothetical protein H4R34_000147 [Dimargaris verticillata]|uniref:Uncharacterized protein n=1 Tax=Dimargaris verticillata TaxID=2761393 RepID=A0A9W8B6R3_9FUNG|nr:hypothetical protein H4R34_000147 [Dimargaris verticillata]
MHRSTNTHPSHSHRARRVDWLNEGHTSSSRYTDNRYYAEPTTTNEPPTLDKNDKNVDVLRSKLATLKDVSAFQDPSSVKIPLPTFPLAANLPPL